MSFKILKFIFLISIFLFFGSGIKASTFDNFDFYNDGNLSGQGNWTGGSDAQIQGIITQGGSEKAVKVATSTELSVRLDFPFLMSKGNLSAWIRTEHKGFDIWPIDINVSPGLATLGFSETGNIEFISGAGTTILLSDYSVDTWYKIEIEWRDSDSKVRGRVVNENWTAWQNPQSSWTQAEQVVLTGGYNGIGYIDTLEYRVSTITISADFTTSTLAYAGALFTDLSLVIYLAIGLPLGFWVIRKVISLVRVR